MSLPVHPSWEAPLAEVEGQIHELGDFLRAQPAYLPAGNDILRAFQDPFDDVRVLIVGQDPYPTPGHPMGLSFSTQPGVAPPRSLVNIYQELQDDLGIPPRKDGDLSSWAGQGILLLNRVLTVAPGKPGSHRGVGWEKVTEAAIRALAQRDEPLVAILWGRDAQTAKRFLGDTPCIESAHPSPLSARRGFFGSRPFSRANEALRAQGADGVDWAL
ncbi:MULTISPECIES: uracil-DNA glycosylase [unclassified Corynebacterium]|uniref:uracil-DNA glycosylase n=1 Tax=unclassified Corynebacterium TaxID=2624378 RepID=UPI00264AD466|nr:MULTISPECIES: uracil-DNA glycosylase [unclassified Corynebacterium]MDN8594392.1 uracil-DNA glycosylase [Corynebacterium sp. P4_F2]WKK56192.1 uracil-DNA glycosylase [Corynebacterium sp. P4-C1]WKK63605.1 uracil-DNA glycosylase [Corynebacterium sp. P8-C1]